MKKEHLWEIEEYMLKNSGDSAHNANHVYRVLNHRYRNDLQPETIEAKILFDADKMDVCGALGIGRTLQYEGMMNYSLYEF